MLFPELSPTAGLWNGQTDESQFGFTYAEADEVLYLYTEKNLALNKIPPKRYPHAEKIINHMKQNEFKHRVPYVIKT